MRGARDAMGSPPQDLCGLKGRWRITIRQKMHDLMEMDLCWQGSTRSRPFRSQFILGRKSWGIHGFARGCPRLESYGPLAHGRGGMGVRAEARIPTDKCFNFNANENKENRKAGKALGKMNLWVF